MATSIVRRINKHILIGLTKTGWELHLCDKFFYPAESADILLRDIQLEEKNPKFLSELKTREGILIHEFGVSKCRRSFENN